MTRMTDSILQPSSNPDQAVQRWEAAYRRFETPEQEERKFLKRLRQLGVVRWDKSLRILELFSGRGNGLNAWEKLGFHHLEGLDLSPDLVARYTGPATCYVGDARALPFPDASRDVICIQGGLHHLPTMGDLTQCLSEIRRVLKPGGQLIVIEPWLTPFLGFVHMMCRVKPLRKVWGKLDALATMIELEGATYRNWLASSGVILDKLRDTVELQDLRIAWGKVMVVGSKVE